MLQNKLKMNDNKTEVIIFGTRHQLKKLTKNTVNVGGIEVKSVDCVCDLGVRLDSNLSMKEHVLKKCKSAFINLYDIKKIRDHLTTSSAEILVHALKFIPT